MEIIRGLEEKFQNLDSKLNSNSKQELANVIYKTDLKRIEHLFKEEKQRYKNGLNECRQEMLDLLIKKRNEQLNEVNEFMQSSQSNSLPQLKSLHKSIKQNYTAFAKGWTSVFESILFRSKLANPLKLDQLVKYTKLMKNEENVSVAKVEHLLDLPHIHVDVLPSDLILLFCHEKRYMVVLNKSGDLVRLKSLEREFKYRVLVTATNVIAYNKDNRIVDVYNFNLELVNSIRLDRFYGDFKLNNYEIALIKRTTDDDDEDEDDDDEDDNHITITCYNYKTAPIKKIEIFINTVELKNILGIDEFVEKACFELYGLNDRILFFLGFAYSRFTNKIDRFALFLLNRYDGNSLFRYIDCYSIDFFLIYNNQVCFDYGYTSDEPFFLVFDLNSDGNFLSKEWNTNDKSVTVVYDTQEYMISNIYSTSNYKYICSKRFDSDNLIFKFRLY